MPEDIYMQDRFYMNLEQNEAIWMYHNPDANSGNQFVSNIFDKELLEEALKTCPPSPENDFGPSDAFDFIGSECRQYCTDPEDYAFEIAKEKFEGEPDAIGCSNTTVETIQLYFEARDLIEKYREEEFEGPAVFSDRKKIGVAYTTTEDGKHEIQAYVNLKDHQTEIYYDGEQIATQKAESLKDYVENQLTRLDFNELVDIPDWVIAEFTKTGIYNPNLKFMEFDAWGDHHEGCIEVSTYMFGGGLYMSLQERCDGELEPYADMTVNLQGFPCEKNCAFVDTNNFAMAESLIKEYKLGKPTGRIGQSGYCTYPEYKFNMDEVRKYCVNPQDIPEVENKPKARVPER